MILDGGRCKVGVESSVVSFLDDGPKLLRQGGMPRAEIEAMLGQAHRGRSRIPRGRMRRASCSATTRRAPNSASMPRRRATARPIWASARCMRMAPTSCRPGAISSRLRPVSSACCTRSTPRASRASPWPPCRITAWARPSTTGCCARRPRGRAHEAQRLQRSTGSPPSSAKRMPSAIPPAMDGYMREWRGIWHGRLAPGAASRLDRRGLAHSRHRQRDAAPRSCRSPATPASAAGRSRAISGDEVVLSLDRMTPHPRHRSRPTTPSRSRPAASSSRCRTRPRRWTGCFR